MIFVWASHYHYGCKWWFPKSSTPSTFTAKAPSSLSKRSHPSAYQSIIYLSILRKDSWVHIFSMIYNSLFNYVDVQTVRLDQWDPLSCSYVPMTRHYHMFEYFFTFWKNKILLYHLVLNLTQPWNQPFFWEALVFVSENEIRDQNLDASYAEGDWQVFTF